MPSLPVSLPITVHLSLLFSKPALAKSHLNFADDAFDPSQWQKHFTTSHFQFYFDDDGIN